MTAEGPNSAWPDQMIAWIKATMHLSLDSPCSDVAMLTSYQDGYLALAALGQADEIPNGFMLRADPKLPDPLPRWDDCASVVVRMARELDRLNIPFPDGTPRPKPSLPFEMKEFQTQHLKLTETIAPAHGLGPALADLDLVPVLHVLGLVSDGHWSAEAVPILWRIRPTPWDIWFHDQPRFAAALTKALEEMPDDVRAELDGLTTITDTDIADVMARLARTRTDFPNLFSAEHLARFPNTPENARVLLHFRRPSDLERVFFRRWRLNDGWLCPTEAKRALEIPADPLAKVMCQEVIKRL